MENTENIDDLKALLEQERAAKADLAAELAAVKTSAATTSDADEVKGELTVEVVVEGKKVKKTFTIAPGQKRIWSPNGNLVPTEKVVALANGKELTEADIKQYPHLAEFVDPTTLKSNGVAKTLLTDMAQRGASVLVEKK